MRSRLAVILNSVLLLVLSCRVAAAAAFTFSSITAIGDSYFDGGNEPTAVVSSYKINGVPQNYIPVPGYYAFKYCDGYTSVEYFAYFMGMYDNNHFYNYGIAGLSTSNLPLVLSYIYSRNAALDPTGLYVIFNGGVDIFQSTVSREQTALNIANAVVDLYLHGARYFMVLNLPRMEDMPNYNRLSIAEIQSVTIAYQAVNSALKSKLSGLSFAANIVQIDMPTFSQLISQSATSVGFTNLSDACVINSRACATPHTYIYWDDIHWSDSTNSHLGSWMKARLDEAALR